MKSLLKFTFTLLPFLIIAGVIIYGNLFVPSPKNNVVYANVVPVGWYLHELGTTSVIMTPSRFMRRIHETELYAYGEQIIISTMPYDGERGQPENWSYLDWTKDKAMVHETVWSTVGDYKVLRIDGEAGGAGGGSLTYFIFTGDTVHTLSLYPSKDSPHLNTFETFVQAYTAHI